MSHRPAARLAWSLYGLVTCLVIITAGVDLLGQGGSTNALQFADEALISLATPLVLATVAALILSR